MSLRPEDIQRYSPFVVTDLVQNFTGTMVENEHGGYVTLDIYVKLWEQYQANLNETIRIIESNEKLMEQRKHGG